jgi:hypothetical protein
MFLPTKRTDRRTFQGAWLRRLAKALEQLAKPPAIEKTDVLAARLPG